MISKNRPSGQAYALYRHRRSGNDRATAHPASTRNPARRRDELQGLLEKIIARLMKLLTRQGYLVEEQGMTHLADMDADNPLASLQAASCSYRIALRPRAGQKVLSLRTVPGRNMLATAGLCADAHGFSLHTGVRCGEHQRKRLERLCRYITRPAIANERQLWRYATVRYGSKAPVRQTAGNGHKLPFVIAGSSLG